MKNKTVTLLTLLSFLFFFAFLFCSLSTTDLIQQVNENHLKIEKVKIDLEEINVVKQRLCTSLNVQYLGDKRCTDQQIPYYSKQSDKYNPKKMISQQQAIEDVDYLFNAFHDCYGPYEYFGGEKVFNAAEKRIKEEVRTKATLTSDDLEKILLKNLAFIQDGHFSINMQRTNPTKIPFFFREVAFLKTGKGYRTTDGRKVESVEGYNNLDDLLKLSISPDGKLVYYPVLLKNCDFWEALKSPQICDETLTIHYSNGDTQKLTAEPYQIYINSRWMNEKEIISFKEENIPILYINSFEKEYTKKIIDGAKWLKDFSVSMIDLRSNSGGYNIGEYFINQYSGYNVKGNGYLIDPFELNNANIEKDFWAYNDNVLVILIGKYTASASERLLDCAYNMENVLFIGENTLGSMLGSSNNIFLPNSLCCVNIGVGTVYKLPMNFEEYAGFYPDIWVPAKEAEELTRKMFMNYVIRGGD